MSSSLSILYLTFSGCFTVVSVLKKTNAGGSPPAFIYVFLCFINYAEKSAFCRKFFSIANAAKNRAVIVGLERNLSLAAAFCAYSRIKLSLGSARLFASHTACLAGLRLIGKSLFCIELLLACGEYELLTAVSAYKCLVFVHSVTSLEKKYSPPRGTPASGHISKNRLSIGLCAVVIPDIAQFSFNTLKRVVS